MQAMQLLKDIRGAESAASSGNETLLASSATSGSAGAPTERPFFSLAEVYRQIIRFLLTWHAEGHHALHDAVLLCNSPEPRKELEY